MEKLDIELLISVAGGLGSWKEDEDGATLYTKDEDCLGELKNWLSSLCSIAGQAAPVNFSFFCCFHHTLLNLAASLCN